MDLGQGPATMRQLAGGGPVKQKGLWIFRFTVMKRDWETNYNVQLYKYDYETGKPLEGSIFRLYEPFDDQDQIQDEDGYGVICRGGESISQLSLG